MGFPNRISRAALGPALEDTWTVTNPKRAIPAASFNLAWWQLAGAGLVVPKAVIGVTITGTTPATTYQALAFDPDGGLPLIVWTRGSAGVYSYSFPSSQYPDENGNLVTLSFEGGSISPQALVGGVAVSAHHERTGPRAGTCRFWTTSPSTFVDVPTTKTFLLTLM